MWLALALSTLFVPALAGAQDAAVTVSMQADRTAVQVGEVFRLEVRADATGSEARIELPDLSAFDVLGREVTTPVRFQFGFGGQQRVVQSTTVHRLTLRARRAGRFELEPAAAVAGGRRFESAPLTIEVGGASAGDPDATAPAVTPPSLGADGTTFDPQGFVRTVVDHARPYVGQQVTVTSYLYVRQPLRGGLSITQEPTTDGFWVHDLLPPTRQLEEQRQNVRGLDFYVYVLRRFAAFPLRSGALTIGGTGASVRSRGGLIDFFDPQPRGPFSRVGVPVTIEAQPLPSEGRPSGNVHVGSLTLTAELDRTQLATGDAAQLTVTASGTGQVQQLRLASPSAPGLRVLEPEIDDEVRSPRDVVSGTRTFRWLIVPEREGTATLGPFEVPFFDPSTRTYAVARTEAQTLTAAGNPVERTPERAEAEQRDENAAALSLGPIRTRSALARSPSRGIASAPWLPWAFALAPLLFAGLLLVRAVRRRGDGARAKRDAKRGTKRRLSAAAAHAAASAPHEFYAAIAQALNELLEAKLERPIGSMTYPALRQLLAQRGMAEALAERVVDELEGCDFARFAAAGTRTEEMQLCLTRAKALVGEIEGFTPRAEDA